MFAQLESVPAGTLKDVLLITMALGGFVLMVIKFADRDKSRRREVFFRAEYPLKEDFDRHVELNSDEHAQLSDRIADVEHGTMTTLDVKLEELRREHREDMQQLQHDVNEIGRKVAGLEAATKLQNSALAHLNAKLDHFIERQNA